MDLTTFIVIYSGTLVLFIGGAVSYCFVLPAIRNRQDEKRRLEGLGQKQLAENPSDFNKKLRALTDGVVSTRYSAIEPKLADHFGLEIMPCLQKIAEKGNSACVFGTMKQIQLIEGTYKDGVNQEPQTEVDKEIVSRVANKLYWMFKENKVAFDWKKNYYGDIEFHIKW